MYSLSLCLWFHLSCKYLVCSALGYCCSWASIFAEDFFRLSQIFIVHVWLCNILLANGHSCFVFVFGVLHFTLHYYCFNFYYFNFFKFDSVSRQDDDGITSDFILMYMYIFLCLVNPIFCILCYRVILFQLLCIWKSVRQTSFSCNSLWDCLVLN